MPLTERLAIRDFHILNYFEPNKRDYIRFRAELDPSVRRKLESEFALLVREGKMMRFERDDYDAAGDWDRRIQSVSREIGAWLEKNGSSLPAGGWTVAGTTSKGEWVVLPGDDAGRKQQWVRFLTKVLGRLTVVFVKAMDMKPEDRWLMSVFLHLLLNSIACHGQEEQEIRGFPAI